MKEICIINYRSTAAAYGIGTYLNEYIYCLKNIGCKIILVELGANESNTEFSIQEDDHVRILFIPQVVSVDSNKYNKNVCRLLRLYIVDSDDLVFHFHYRQSDSLLDRMKVHFPRSKFIFTIHYLSWSAKLQGNASLLEKIIRNQESKQMNSKYDHVLGKYKDEKVFLEKFDRIVCLSNDTLHLVHNQYGIDLRNLEMIPNGLRKNVRRLSMKQKCKLREKYHIRPDEKILLFVGRINPIKGINNLIACFDEVLKAYPDCRLVMIGSGRTDETLEKCRNTWLKCTFTGRMDKKTLCQWYQIADVALFPSYYEECSYVGIEMMMHGLPIIASDGYSVKNMFHEGINAKIVKIDNWDRKSKFRNNLKDSILQVLNSSLPELEIQKGARRTYQLQHSIELMQKKYSDLFNTL